MVSPEVISWAEKFIKCMDAIVEAQDGSVDEAAEDADNMRSLLLSLHQARAEVERVREAGKNVVDCWGVGRLNITAMNRFVDELRSLLSPTGTGEDSSSGSAEGEFSRRAAPLPSTAEAPAASLAEVALKASATRLRAHLFGARHDLGMVGVGKDDFFVYVHSPEVQWRGPKPATWEGIAIEWRWDIGPVVAYAQEGVSEVEEQGRSAVIRASEPPLSPNKP